MLPGVAAAGFWLAAFRTMHSRFDALPLMFGLASVGTLLLGFVIALWPYLAPFRVSFESAAASQGVNGSLSSVPRSCYRQYSPTMRSPTGYSAAR